LTFDLLTLKVVSESHVTWATSVPIVVDPRPLCSQLRPDVRDRQTDVLRRASSLNAPYPMGGGIIRSMHHVLLVSTISEHFTPFS